MRKSIKKSGPLAWHVRFSEEDYGKILKKYKKTTCRSMSEYIRTILLAKTIHVKYRNTSLDQALEELTDLRMDLKRILQHIGERPEESMQEQSSDSPPNAMDSSIEGDILQTIERIMEHISNFSDIWSQYSRT